MFTYPLQHLNSNSSNVYGGSGLGETKNRNLKQTRFMAPQALTEQGHDRGRSLYVK